MQIIYENVEYHYTTKNVYNIIPQFTATYEDIKKMKQLKVRNVQVQSKSENFLGQQNIEGIDEVIPDKSFNPEAFFNNILNSFY
jgi:hypothetical protein